MLSKPKILLPFLCLIFFQNTYAQTFQVLKERWLHAETDTAKINAGLKLYENYYEQSNDSFFAHNNFLLTIFNFSEKINYSYGIIKSSFNLGNFYNGQSNSIKSIQYYFLSLKESEKANDRHGIARAEMGIGLVHFTQNNWVKSLEYFKKSLSISKERNDPVRISTAQYLIGLCLNSLKQYITAKHYLDSALKIKLELKNSQGINECYLGLANTFKGLNELDSAAVYYEKVLSVMLAQKEYYPVSIIYSSFGEIEYLRGNMAEALAFAIKGYNYSKLFYHPSPKLVATEILYKIYTKIGDFQNALKYNELFYQLKDSIENRDFSSQISVAQTTYDFEKKQAQIKAEQDKINLQYAIDMDIENRKKYILSGVAVLCILFIIAIFIAYRSLNNQKKISENLLLNILPKETAIELKKFGKAISKNHKSVSILFCDVKEFTLLAEKLTPEKLVEMIDYYFRQFDSITESYGLEKIKAIGDAYMCAGGLNNETGNSALNTLNVAVEFLKFSAAVNDDIISKFGRSFNFRLGIHSGNVISGVVGKNKYSYDIWGDAVNIAARMEQNSLPGRINISGDTYELVKNHFDFIYRGKIPVKNKGEIDMYFLV